MKALIESVELTDFGPFEGKQKFEFDGPGTYAVCASNGSGKSHVILGAKITTGPSSKLAKPLGAYVNRYGFGSKSAKIRTKYAVGDKALDVTRTITLKLPDTQAELTEILQMGKMPDASSRWSAKYDGQSHKSASDVAELVNGLFGLAGTTQEDAVFVLQNQAGRILHETPSVRSKELQILSGADVCQKAADLAQRKLANLNVVDRQPEIDELQDELNNLVIKLAELDRTIDELEKTGMSDQEADQLAERLREARGAREAANKLLEIDEALAAHRKSRDIVKSEITALELDLRLKLDTLESKKATYEQARAYLAAQSANRSLYEQRQKLMAALTEAENEPNSHPEPAKPQTPRGVIAELEAELQELESNMAAARKFLETFERTGMCPTCGSKPQNVDELVTKNKTYADQHAPLLDELRKTLRAVREAWSDYDRACEGHTVWKTQWLKRVDSLSRDYDNLKHVAPVDEEEIKRCQQVAREYEDLESSVRVTEGNVVEKEKTLAYIDSQIENEIARSRECSAEVDRAMPPEELEKKQQVLMDNKALQTQLSETRGNRTALDSQIKSLHTKIETLKEKQEQVAKQVKAREFLEGLKAVMHHSAIPHDRAVLYLESLNAGMQEYCKILHAPFELFVDPDTQHFMAQTEDGIVPAYQLSGGQSTLAAWAWHLSLYEKHGSQVGFIFMDEPTTGLDEANLDNVGEAVQRLTSYCQGAGLQFVMVTHEASLASVFDRVIRI